MTTNGTSYTLPTFDENSFAADFPNFAYTKEDLGKWSPTSDSWQDLSIFVTEGKYEKLVRSYDGALAYHRWRTWCTKHYANTESYIKINTFGYSATKTPDGRLLATGQPSKVGPILKPNDYPYFLPQGAEHWLLWNGTKLNKEAIREKLSDKFPKGKFELLVFENPSVLRTIPGVYHTHAFVRPKEPGSDPEVHIRWSPQLETESGDSWATSPTK